MKLYNSMGPNPRIVRMFLAEKGLDVDKVEVDIVAGENRKPPYNQSVNRTGQCPALELDDGATITEVTAICGYLEELNPELKNINAWFKHVQERPSAAASA